MRGGAGIIGGMMKKTRYSGLSFYQREKKASKERVSGLISWIFTILLAIFLAFSGTLGFGIRTSIIGNSMEPGLFNGQVVYIDRVIYKILEPRFGDVVCFYPNGNSNSHVFVKRVIAVPGDTVVIKDGTLYLNDKPMEDLFLDKIADPGIASEPITVDFDEYFVMGDNCNSSEDSRSANLGKVSRQHIVGKAWLHMAGGDSGIGFIKGL